MASHPEFVTVLVGFLVLLSSIAVIALLLKASVESLTDESAGVLAALAVISGVAAAIILPTIRTGLGIFCVVIAALAGLILCVRAIMDDLGSVGGGVLLSLFILLGATGYFLIAWS